jgi:hypothetical protein
MPKLSAYIVRALILFFFWASGLTFGMYLQSITPWLWVSGTIVIGTGWTLVAIFAGSKIYERMP